MFGKNGSGAEKLVAEIHALYDKAERKLKKQLGVPICVPGCGKCCEVNNITVRGVEIEYIALWLRKQKQEFQDKVLDICEQWLLSTEFEATRTDARGKSRTLSIFRGMGTMGMSMEEIDQLRMEASFLVINTKCVLLDEDKRCLIHPARPIVCRAFGVTRVVGREICPRPISKLESENSRGYVNDDMIVPKIKAKIEELKKYTEGHHDYISFGTFIPTLLYAMLRPQRFYDLAYKNLIPSVKFSQMNSIGNLWQRQLENQLETEQEIRMLVTPTV